MRLPAPATSQRVGDMRDAMPMPRGKPLRHLGLHVLALVLLICGAGVVESAPSKSEVALVLEDFALSPDGHIAAFEYQDVSTGQHDLGLGLLDLASGKLTRIPNPPGKQLSMPSFSYDGKRLAAAMGAFYSLQPSQIVIIDLGTSNVTEITAPVPVESKDFPFSHYPVFQPGTDNVLYVQNNIFVPKHLQLLSQTDHTAKTIIGPKEGFYEIFRPSFVGPEDILFQAMDPRDPVLKQSAVDLLGKDRYDPALRITYRLHFGGRPEIFLPKLTQSRTGPLLPGIPYLTASRDGETIAFTGLSIADPYNEHHQYNYEIFALRNGQLRQMTNLRSLLAYAHISFDGTTVAFGSDPSRRKIVDLFILDLPSGKITATGLLGRLQHDPEFWLH